MLLPDLTIGFVCKKICWKQQYSRKKNLQIYCWKVSVHSKRLEGQVHFMNLFRCVIFIWNLNRLRIESINPITWTENTMFSFVWLSKTNWLHAFPARPITVVDAVTSAEMRNTLLTSGRTAHRRPCIGPRPAKGTCLSSWRRTLQNVAFAILSSVAQKTNLLIGGYHLRYFSYSAVSHASLRAHL